MPEMKMTDNLKGLWTEFAVDVAGANPSEVEPALDCVVGIGDDGRVIVDHEQARVTNAGFDWNNAFWLAAFASVVSGVILIAGQAAAQKGWQAVRSMSYDEFQKRERNWSRPKPQQEELERKAFEFAQQREQELRRYLEELSKQSPS